VKGTAAFLGTLVSFAAFAPSALGGLTDLAPVDAASPLSQATSAPLTQKITETVAAVTDAAAPVTAAAPKRESQPTANVANAAALEPVSAATAPLALATVAPVSNAASPVVQQTTTAVAPVTDAVAPVVHQTTALVQPVTETIAAATTPVVTTLVVPVVQTVSTVTAPVLNEASEVLAATAPVTELVAPVLTAAAPVTEPLLTTSLLEQAAGRAPADTTGAGSTRRIAPAAEPVATAPAAASVSSSPGSRPGPDEPASGTRSEPVARVHADAAPASASTRTEAPAPGGPFVRPPVGSHPTNVGAPAHHGDATLAPSATHASAPLVPVPDVARGLAGVLAAAGALSAFTFLAALLGLFVLPTPSVGRWLRPALDVIRPPGVVSPIEVPG
jgi:hypothetical protein